MNEPHDYEPPTITKVGSLSDLTQAGQLKNADERKKKNSAYGEDSI